MDMILIHLQETKTVNDNPGNKSLTKLRFLQ